MLNSTLSLSGLVSSFLPVWLFGCLAVREPSPVKPGQRKITVRNDGWETCDLRGRLSRDARVREVICVVRHRKEWWAARDVV